MNEKKWICELCEKEFTTRQNLWAHQHRTKTPCITKDKCIELVQQVQSKDSRINYFKNKVEETNQKHNEELEKKEKEIEYLKSLLSKNEELSDKLDLVKESVEAVQKNNNSFTCNQNYLVNKNYLTNKNSIINIAFSKPRQEN